MGIASPFVGRIYDAYGPRILLVAGVLLMSGGLRVLTTVGATISTALLVWTNLIMVALSATFTPLLMAGLGPLPRLLSHGSAVLGTFQQVITVVAIGATGAGSDTTEAAGTIAGVRAEFLVAAIAPLVLLPAALLVREPESVTPTGAGSHWRAVACGRRASVFGRSISPVLREHRAMRWRIAPSTRTEVPAAMTPLSPLTVDGVVPAETALPHTWNRCVGAGRANEALRADWQEHFAEAVGSLGMRAVRFHGLFHDDMFVYRATGGSGFELEHELARPVHTFSYVDKVFDAILALGARPFVELGFMPRELATQTETLFWWGAHASPPKDMGRWVELVSATVRHWIERYGADEVRQWRFEVWNEPNLVPLFWTGTRTQYFELYEATARAIKVIDPSLRVGGPSTSVFVPDDRYVGETEDRAVQVAVTEAPDVDALDWRPVWIEEFIDWCATRDVPVDFLTTHLYPTDFAYGADGGGKMLSRYADATRDDLLRMREIIATSPFPTAELHITEWSTTPSSRDAVHDTVYAATYVTRAYLQCASLADSISYWAFTDVFEEGGAGIGPFHGGFGIVNEHGIHKPMFHAFSALAALGDRLLLSTPHGVVTRDSAVGSISAVFFNYPDDMNGLSVGPRDTYAQTRDLAAKGPARRIRHDIGGLAPGSVFRVTVLDLDHGNVVEEWDRIGAPLNLTRAQTEHLRTVADELATWSLTVTGDGVLEIDVELAPWAVMSLVAA